MKLSDKIDAYLNSQKFISRSTEQVYTLIAEERGERFSEAVKDLLAKRCTESVSTERFYDIVASTEIREISLYDLFASRARKAMAWNLERLCDEIMHPFSILDAGCGTGIVSCFMGIAYPEANIDGMDIASGMIEAAQKRAAALNLRKVHFSEGDILQYDEKKFDYVICVHALDESCNMHREESARISHLRSLLAEDGKLILIRAGMHKKEGFEYEGEIYNGDLRESLLFGIPEEILYRFNDADGEGMEQGLTVWKKLPSI